MKYINGEDVLPKELLRKVQEYCTGYVYIPATRKYWRRRREEVVLLAEQSVDTGGIARRMRISERRVRQILAEETGGNGFRKKPSAGRH